MQKEVVNQLQNILQNTFQFDQFRPGQLEAINTLIEEGRLLCIQPTGYGKSLLYQLPAMMLDGITLVISPLLALMRDQINQLKNRFGIAAASINSDQTIEENNAAKRAALMGTARILFISPEQLDQLDKFEFLLRLPICLLVVDEAHCISTWGHDFRPSYRQIIQLAHALNKKNPEIKILALTATANTKTEVDIKKQLTVSKKEMNVYRESMNRPNIRLSVIPLSGMAMKLATLVGLLKVLQGSGVIYCATRENTELAAEYLCQQGINAAAYHAGMDTYTKRHLQQGFLEDKYTVLTATNALGMGIDKSNLRFIIHFDMPGSITAYYQEVGRCGRDGLAADGILLYDRSDSKIQSYFIDSSQPSRRDFETVLEIIRESDTSLNLATIKQLTGLHPTRLTVVLAELIEQSFLKKMNIHGRQSYQFTGQKGKPDLERYQIQYKVKMGELENMQSYAESSSECLMKILRHALGDKETQACQRCSCCSETLFQSIHDKDKLISISAWLNRRALPISLSSKIKHSVVGIAALDGKLRSKDFISFMQSRAQSSITQLGLTDNLMQIIKDCLSELMEHYQFSCIVPLPTRTWGARNGVVCLLANFLKIPAMPNLLFWKESPTARQGELLNNDQRQHNVKQRMYAEPVNKINKGSILLFDDYIGSGATMNEAARALRDHANVDNEIVPFTIASVKWRLGHQGMI